MKKSKINMGTKQIIKVLFAILALLFIRVDSRAEDSHGFASIKGPCGLEFPKDHGPHRNFRTEWWYYTGNVFNETGRPFGFQLTFFRSRIIAPGEKNLPFSGPVSNWRTGRIIIVHVALSNISEKIHLQKDFMVREALGMAGIKKKDNITHLFLRACSLTIKPEIHHLKAQTSEFGLNLSLTPLKPPVMHGDLGYSQKGTKPASASCYYSFTRLDTRGQIQLGSNVFNIRGLSWMDHEFSTSPLEADLVGWDWFSIQLDNETELMLYFLRKNDGSFSSASSGTFIDRSGNGHHLTIDEIFIKVDDSWKSKATGIAYPSMWRITIPSLNLDLTATPRLENQEMETKETTGVNYWEGSVRIEGTFNGKNVSGYGYTELTGYGKPFDAPM